MSYWVALDGEGLGRTPHQYVMMAYSDVEGHSDLVENENGLTSKQCLNFILSIPSDARVCGYYLGYDWTKILQDLPNQLIYRLLRPELRALPKDEGGGFSYIHWEGYKLHYLAGMMRIRKGNRMHTVWDLGKFFQAPFVDAIEAWEIVAPLADIRKMKDERSRFHAGDWYRIKSYCLSECRALAELATKLEGAHDDVGIRPKSWHGPGSTASALMKVLNIGEKRGEHPREVLQAADYAFFGGRFEHSMIGMREQVYGFDIVSAYPYQAYYLPCLTHSKWKLVKRERGLQSARQACVHFDVQDIGSEVWAPLPCRLKNGSIVFPRSGFSGWVWLDEYRAAVENWNGVRFREAWVLHQDCDCQPFSELLSLFRQRVALGKSGRGRILKLALNSVYGKLAQTIGSPQFASRIWSGMITSGTRAQLLRLLAKHKDRGNVLALATDGLFTTERVPVPYPPLYPDLLGSWESSKPHDMVFVRPGIYWSTDGETVRARGIGRRQLQQRDAVLTGIEYEDSKVEVGESDLFGGARASVYRLRNGQYKRSRHYGEWRSIPAKVSLNPAPKRTADWGLHMLPGVESMPYSKAPLSDDAKALKVLGDLFWGMR